MGVNRDPAVRLRVTCGQLKSADQFAPGRGKWVACQQTQPSRADRPGTPHDPHAAVRARARDQALRHLGPEHLDAYRTLYQAERRTIPDTVPTARAGKQAVSRALRALEPQHHPLQAVRERVADLFAQGVPPSSVARQLSVARQTAVTWRDGWRSGGTAALRSRGLSRHPAMLDSMLPMIERALLESAEVHGLTATCGHRP